MNLCMDELNKMKQDGRLGTTIKLSRDKRGFSQPKSRNCGDAVLTTMNSDDNAFSVEQLSAYAVTHDHTYDTLQTMNEIVTVEQVEYATFLSLIKDTVLEKNGSVTTQVIAATKEEFHLSNPTTSSLFLRNLERCRINNKDIVFDISITRKIDNPKYTRISGFMLRLWQLEPTECFAISNTLNVDHSACDLLFDFLHFGNVAVNDENQFAKELCFLFSTKVASPYITAIIALYTILNLPYTRFANFVQGCIGVDFKNFSPFLKDVIMMYYVENGFGETGEIDVKESNFYVKAIMEELKLHAFTPETCYLDFQPIEYPYMWQSIMMSILNTKGKRNVLKIMLQDVYHYGLFSNLNIDCESNTSLAYQICEKVLNIFADHRKPSDEKALHKKYPLNAYQYIYQKMLDDGYYFTMPDAEILPAILEICDQWNLYDRRSFVTNDLTLLDVASKFPDMKAVLLPFMLNFSNDLSNDIQTFISYSKEWFNEDIVRWLDMEPLSEILASDDLYALEELDVINICYEWATHKESLNVGVNAKEHFSKIKKFIRFPLVDANVLNKEIIKWNVLEPCEVDAIILNSVLGNSRSSGYSDTPRRYTQSDSPKAAGFLHRYRN